MNKKLYILLVAAFICFGASSAFADRHHDRGHDRKENSGHSKNYNNRFENNRSKDKRNHNDFRKLEKERKKEYKKNYKHGYDRPVPPPPSHYAPPRPPKPYNSAYRPLPASYDRQFRRMVSYATRGASDIAVWQISNDTFIVRYFRGGRYYTQYLYPYSGRYGSRSHISVNWTPNSLWELIPSINLNINL